MKLRWKNAPMGAKILTIIIITISLISIGAIIYFILKQFGAISSDKCQTSNDCNKGMYCTFNPTFKYHICESCCHANSGLNKGGSCEKCKSDPHRKGDCPDFECKVANT